MSPTASPKAFTLIEVMMAATILVVSFSAVIMAVGQGAEMIDTARKQQIAQQIIEGEIAYQRNSTWLWSQVGNSGIQEMGNAGGLYRIKVNDPGTATLDDTVNGRDDLDYFGLDNNPALVSQAKAFTCQVQSQGLRGVPGGPTMMAMTWTVTWPGIAGRNHSCTGMATFAQNGLLLSYQK